MSAGGPRLAGSVFAFNKNKEQQINDLLLSISIIGIRLNFVRNLRARLM